MKILYLIPARGGSKGLPNKNIKELNSKPLIHYSIDYARKFVLDDDICVSTDSDEIVACVNQINLSVRFKRPDEIATDTSSTNEVIVHALNKLESEGKFYDLLILLQPTSPFRKAVDFKNMLKNWDNNLDLMVSVKEPHDSPYFNIFEENSLGYLEKSKATLGTRRQDVPKVYTYNGSIYIFNVKSLKEKPISSFDKIKKYIMNDPICSIDIDNHFDWLVAETIINSKMFEDAE